MTRRHGGKKKANAHGEKQFTHTKTERVKMKKTIKKLGDLKPNKSHKVKGGMKIEKPIKVERIARK